MFLARRIVLLSFSLVLSGCAQPNQYKPPPPPNVKVAKPVIQTVTNYLEETGTSEAVQRVEIRARVSGFLEQIEFQDGQDVKKGDRLYLIQPSEYENAVAQATANVEFAKVEVERAKSELDRQEELFKKQSTPEAKLFEIRANYNGAVAAEKAALAKLDQAKLNRKYCEINSPIDGRVERTRVKLGNLVGNEDATHLTTVVSYDPIHVYFSISERALLQATRGTRKESSSQRADIAKIPAYLRRAVDHGFPFEGNLDYADLGVDQSTGTFTIRAEFRNPNLDILPGLFVRVRIPLGPPESAVLLPERSVGFDQVGRYVMLVGDDNVVERRNVELGAKYGEMVVITSGLTGDETVVIDGIQRARPGAEVTPNVTQLPPVQGSLETVDEGNDPMAERDVASPEAVDVPAIAPESEAVESLLPDDSAESNLPSE